MTRMIQLVFGTTREWDYQVSLAPSAIVGLMVDQELAGPPYSFRVLVSLASDGKRFKREHRCVGEAYTPIRRRKLTILRRMTLFPYQLPYQEPSGRCSRWIYCMAPSIVRLTA